MAIGPQKQLAGSPKAKNPQQSHLPNLSGISFRRPDYDELIKPGHLHESRGDSERVGKTGRNAVEFEHNELECGLDEQVPH